MSEKEESMWAIPALYAREVAFELSPSPEYRSAIRDVKTGVVIAIDWDGNVFRSSDDPHAFDDFYPSERRK